MLFQRFCPTVSEGGDYVKRNYCKNHGADCSHDVSAELLEESVGVKELKGVEVKYKG